MILEEAKCKLVARSGGRSEASPTALLVNRSAPPRSQGGNELHLIIDVFCLLWLGVSKLRRWNWNEAVKLV